MTNYNNTQLKPYTGIIDVSPEIRNDLSRSVYERAGIIDLKAFYSTQFDSHPLGDFVTGNPLAAYDIRYCKEYFIYSNVQQPGKVLDLGCGSGRFGILKTRPGVTLYGVDVTNSGFDNARSVGYDQLVAHDILQLPFEDNFFDYVVSLDVLGHVEAKDKGRLLTEIRRVLKPGGLTLHGIEEGYADYSNMTDDLIDYIRVDGHVGLQTITQIQNLFEQFFPNVLTEFAFGVCHNYWDILKYRNIDLPDKVYHLLENFNAHDIEIFSLTVGIIRQHLAAHNLLKGGGFAFVWAGDKQTSELSSTTTITNSFDVAFESCNSYSNLLKYKKIALPPAIYQILEKFNEREIEVFSLAIANIRQELATQGLLDEVNFNGNSQHSYQEDLTIDSDQDNSNGLTTEGQIVNSIAASKDYRNQVENLAELEQVVEAQQGSKQPLTPNDIDLTTVRKFSPNLPQQFTETEKQNLLAQAEKLHPWLQGPFYMGGDLMIGGAWRNDNRWKILEDELPASLQGRRVLDIGTNAGYDCFEFNLRQPDFVMGIDPGHFIEQAFFLNNYYKTPVKFEKIGWQDLDPQQHGLFNFVHCHGVLYHEEDPMMLLNKLATVISPGGELYLGCFVLQEEHLTNYARFIPDSFWNDPTWWWVFGRECLKQLVESAGFELEKEFGYWSVPNGDFPIANVYYKARRTSQPARVESSLREGDDEVAKENVRQAVKEAVGTDRPEIKLASLEGVVHFSPNLPATYSKQEKKDLLAQVDNLHPWLQGPFYLGGDLAISGAWPVNERWVVLGPEVPEDLSGKRVLDIGTNAGYDPFSFNLRNPDFVMAIDPEIFIEQSRFLNRIYKTPIKFEKIGWQDLDPKKHGLFDLIHCNGVYYHEQNIVSLIRKLTSVLAPSGTLFLGGFVLYEAELTDYARYIGSSFWNDPTWWWVPGINCFRSIAEVCGLEVVKEFGRWDVPNGDFPVSSFYLKTKKPNSVAIPPISNNTFSNYHKPNNATVTPLLPTTTQPSPLGVKPLELPLASLAPEANFSCVEEQWEQIISDLDLKVQNKIFISEVGTSLPPASTDVVGVELNAAITQDNWIEQSKQIEKALYPNGLAVLETTKLTRAFHSSDFEEQIATWTQRFAQLSRSSFSFYRHYKNYLGLQKERLNILYLAPWVSYGGSDKGTIDWFKHLDRNRFRLYLLTTQISDNALISEIEPYAEEIWSLPDFMRGNAMPQFIMDFIASRNIHLLHIMNSRLAYDMLPVFKTYYPHLRTVVQLHVEEEDRTGYCRYVTTRYDNLIDAYSVTSQHLKQSLLHYQVSPAKLQVIYTGVDCDNEFNPEKIVSTAEFRATYKLTADKFHVLFPARLDEQKDPFLMLQVATALKQYGSKAVIHAVGEGTLQTKLETTITQNGLQEQVILHGASRQMPFWYKNTAVTLLTSRFEGVPYVIYEAMAMGQPVVTSNVGANAELVDQTTGFLINQREAVDEYVAAILHLENNPQLLKQFGQAARNKIKGLSLDKMARDHEALYHQLAASHVINLIRTIR